MADAHAKRRAAIVAAHPDVQALAGPDARTAILTGTLVAGQTALAAWVAERSMAHLIVLAYAVGAVASHALFLCVHEAAHNLVFARPAHNRACALVANLPAVLPYASVFRHFHLLHHTEHGVPGLDTDVPSETEAWLVVHSATGYVDRCVRKTLYLAVYLAVYAVRPLLVCTSPPPALTRWSVANAALQAAYVCAVVACCGPRALAYLALSTLLAGSLHPVAAHFQAEHTEQVAGVETYSYYGALNAVSLNVGLHNEHHDFPSVPWTRLPALRALAPAFYADAAHQCTAWPGFLVRYITCDALGPHARVVRAKQD